MMAPFILPSDGTGAYAVPSPCHAAFRRINHHGRVLRSLNLQKRHNVSGQKPSGDQHRARACEERRCSLHSRMTPLRRSFRRTEADLLVRHLRLHSRRRLETRIIRLAGAVLVTRRSLHVSGGFSYRSPHKDLARSLWHRSLCSIVRGRGVEVLVPSRGRALTAELRHVVH
jgi:hypothetical protein